MESIIKEFSCPQLGILESDARINLFLAGYGSGKTYLGGVISYRFVSLFPQVFGFIGANTYEQLDKSTMYRIKETWRELGITEWSKENPRGCYVSGVTPPAHFNVSHHNFESYRSIITFVNGGTMFTGSLENAKSHDGKQFGWAILDETKDTRAADVKEIILSRLRQQGIELNGKPVCPMYILTSPAKVDWINEWFSLEDYRDEINAIIYSKGRFFEKRFADKYVSISSTHHNMPNLPVDYIDTIRLNNSEERAKAMIYANPFATTGGEFYSSFSRDKHVGKVCYNPSLPIHVSFDQNVIPYNSCLIIQVEKRAEHWDVMCVGEICLEPPHNSTQEVCEALLRQYGDASGLFYYGDATGGNRSVLSKDAKHHYEVVERCLSAKLHSGSRRLLKKNPSVVGRRDFINRILENKEPIRIIISENCYNLLADMTYLKLDVDGGKRKELRVNPDTNQKYQKYGHLSDEMDYFMCSAFERYFKKK